MKLFHLQNFPLIITFIFFNIIIVFNNSLFSQSWYNHAELEWKETFGKNNKSTGWSASNDNMNCKISKSMSDQLWTEIKEDYVDEEYSITIR